ncbi:MAG: hypothetical protein AB7F20_05480 [Geoalkalibacter sp.]|jgi:hypothetical protein|uniref:hypothetical protein n=1 Tax=Geoalkalibacter sp. TaxID=3041440 RepID=UPI002A958F1A|nr:hypothetical protein [Thermodesulfobacteriota bacterium]
MHIDKTSRPFPLSPGLIRILEEQMEKARTPKKTGATLTFRDPTYCPEGGGFHHV